MATVNLTEREAAQAGLGKRPHKYHAKAKTVNGIRFASKYEARCYEQLRLAERAGHITDLQLQVPFDLIVNGVSVGKFISDFVYNQTGQRVVADAKGYRTPVYKLKKKLMLAIYGIEIQEI